MPRSRIVLLALEIAVDGVAPNTHAPRVLEGLEARSGARVARAVSQIGYQPLEPTQVNIANRHLDEAPLLGTEIHARKPFKAVARGSNPVGALGDPPLTG